MIMQSEVYILKKQIYFFTSLLLLSVTIFVSTSVVTITEYKLSYDNLPKEFDGFNDTNERLDLLALDKNGNLVIIENKLDDSGKNVVWQALKYAGYCSSLKKDEIKAIFQQYLITVLESYHIHLSILHRLALLLLG